MKFLIFLFFLVAFVSANAVGSAKKYRDDYTYFEDTNAFYKFHRMKLTFGIAVETCRAEGAELYMPTSEQEIVDFYKKWIKNEEYTWIGAHDQFGEGIFVTLGGQFMQKVFSNWGAGEPTLSGDEGCVTVNNEGKFIEYGCDSRYQFICRKDPLTIVENEKCNNFDPEYFVNAELAKCYKLHTRAGTWKEAFRTCALEGGYLAIISSEAEANMFIKRLTAFPTSQLVGNFSKDYVFVGFNDIVSEGVYKTVDGKLLSESGYVKWAQQSPDNYENNEDCGAMMRDGFLEDVNCNEYAMFFCEKNIKESYYSVTP